jgi:hypothetical protein
VTYDDDGFLVPPFAALSSIALLLLLLLGILAQSPHLLLLLSCRCMSPLATTCQK